MRGMLVGIAWLFFITLARAEKLEVPAPTPVSGKISWVYDYEEGKQLSKETGKPMFVVFRCER